MKQSFHSNGLLLSLLSLLLLSSFSNTAARLLVPKQGEEEVKKVNGFLQTSPIIEIEQDDPLNVMGVEYCGNGDEECLKRRIVAEAHLDYIYTQHHKP